jgi:F-type H+-transporting ATPase subunit delta
MTGALGVHYAHALADTVFTSESGLKPEQALAQLGDAVSTVDGSKELQDALLSPAISKDKKIKVVSDLAELLGAHRIIRNFLSVVVTHRRIRELPAILREFRQIVDEKLGIVSAEIVSAKELTGQERQQVEHALGQKLGKSIRANYRVNPSLLGGVRARVASREYDATLQGKLQALRQRLVAQ